MFLLPTSLTIHPPLCFFYFKTNKTPKQTTHQIQNKNLQNHKKKKKDKTNQSKEAHKRKMELVSVLCLLNTPGHGV